MNAHNYNLDNLKFLYTNSSNIKSRIYTKQRLFVMLKKKQTLIFHLNNNIQKINNYQSYIFHHPNQSNINIKNRIIALNKSYNQIIKLLRKIEWEENLILSTIKTSTNYKFNCLNILKSFFKCFN